MTLFIVLGIWQLNRAEQKAQLMTTLAQPTLNTDSTIPMPLPLYRQVSLDTKAISEVIFLLDNKTKDGQFGYEVFQLHQTDIGILLISLGWTTGSLDRNKLPMLELPDQLVNQRFTIRPAPKNPIFDVSANSLHVSKDGVSDKNIWIVQSMSTQWIKELTGYSIIGFAQLIEADKFGIGPVIWQPNVMSAMRHRGYAAQWFSMAIALLVMFLITGSRRPTSEADPIHNPSTKQSRG